jgi:hypothetical protein
MVSCLVGDKPEVNSARISRDNLDPCDEMSRDILLLFEDVIFL